MSLNSYNLQRKVIVDRNYWKELLFYIIMYSIRTSLFIIIGIKHHIDLLINKKSRVAVNNTIIGYICSLFQYYFTFNMVLTENIYAYYIALLVMVHNAVITILILGYIHFSFTETYWTTITGITASYILELAVTVVFIVIHHGSATMLLFRRVGANPVINEMYSTRKKLETLGSMNTIIPILMCERLFVPPSVMTVWADWALVILTMVLTVIQQVLIFSCMYDENLPRRWMAIAITGLKFVMALTLLIVVPILYIYNAMDLIHTPIRPIFYADEMVISLVFLYYLIQDTRNFGKGLKKALERSKVKLSLRNDYLDG